MQLDRLVNFIEKYGVDFLEDGTKKRILESLKEGDYNLASEIMNTIDKDFVERTKEINMFYVFTDIRPFDDHGNKLTKPFYRTSYIDSLGQQLQRIPTLRKVQSKEIGSLWYDDSYEFDK